MQILFLDEVDSTQRVAIELVQRGERAWDAVCAEHQTAGRGRRGAHWHDEPGASLLVSLILWDVPLPDPPGLIGVMTAIAAAESLERLFPALQVQLKYPNDLVVHGRKLGGILVEIAENVAVVGIGVNLAQREFPEPLQASAISVWQAIAYGGSPSPPCPFSHAVGEGVSETLSPSGGEGTGEGVASQQSRGNPSPQPSPQRGEGVSRSLSPSDGEGERVAETLSPACGGEGTGEGEDSTSSRAVRTRLIEAIAARLHALVAELTQAGTQRIHALWQARDASAGRPYQVLDLPQQPVGVALQVEPDFRLRLRLPDGSEHCTYWVHGVFSIGA